MLPVERFAAFIEFNDLFGHSSKVLAAVSGGMDSVLMVHLLKSAGFEFGIAHCNFQLRGQESISDHDFCKQLALQLGVSFHAIAFDTLNYASGKKISVQMAARELRYQWFEQIRQQYGYTAIALAHHQNDAIETILLNLTRGTGIAGLHGILPKNGFLVRPLLFLGRDEIQTIIDENHLSYVEDSSNASVKYARNKIRLEVIPKLKALNPALEETFENNLQHFRDLEMLLEKTVNELKKEFFIAVGDDIHLNLERLQQLEPQRLLLFKLLQEFGFSQSTINDLITALNKHPGKVFESESHQLILDRDRLILVKKQGHPCSPVTINQADQQISFGSYQLNISDNQRPFIIKGNPLVASVDAALLIYPLTLRNWHQGDTFYPLGMKNGRKLSDFFISEKIPLHQKQQVPVLVNGNGDIMWVGGYRPDDRYKITDKTKKVTIFELFKQK